MTSPLVRSSLVLMLLVGGISLAFLTSSRGREEGASHAPPPRPGGEAAGPLEALGPRLRGLPAGTDGEVAARSLVDGALGGLEGSPRPRIAAALRSDDWGAQWAGLLGIPRYGPPDAAVVDGLRRALESDVAQVRRTAAEACGYLGPDRFAEVEPGLVATTGSADADVRAAALQTLARHSRRRVDHVALFAGALEDPEVQVRAAGAYGLAQLELQEVLERPALEALLPALRRCAGEASTDVCVYAVMALGRAGPAAAAEVDGLIALLEDDRALVRGQAATALGSIGPAALPAIERALQGGMRRSVPSMLWALRQMGEPALPLLARTLEHPHPVVRALAAQKLWELGHDVDRALDELVGALGGGDVEAKRLAARCFARMGPEGTRALPGLRALRADADETVREAAQAAVAHLERVAPGR